MQLVPFHFIDDIVTETAGLPLWAVLRSFPVLQFIFNIALFVPLGVVVRRFLSRGVFTAALSGLAISLLIEATQYTGIWGIYGCAYRLADVDDLLAKTTGAIVGAVVAPLLLWWMPAEAELRPRRLLARPVTARRRWMGMVFDWALFWVLGTVLGVAFVGVPRSLGADIPVWMEAIAATLLPGIFVFLIPALRRSGESPGQRAVWLRIDWRGRRATLGKRMVRSSVALAWTLSMTIGSLVPDNALYAGSTLAAILVVTEVIVVGLTRGRGVGAILAGTTFADSRPRETFLEPQ